MSQATFKPVHTHEEIETTASLASLIWRETYATLLQPEQIDYMIEKLQSAGAIQSAIENDGYEYYIVEYEGQNAGYLGVQPADGKLLLSKVYLQAAWHGKGIAPQIFRYCEQLAARRGCDTLWLTVNRHNARAVAAYKKNGFAVARTQVVDIGGGFVMDDYVMEKKIDDLQ